jgi:adenosylcobinamide-phosphate synthase
MPTCTSFSFPWPDWSLWWLPPLALLLDMFLADPECLPHPVRGIAFLAERLEKPARATERPLMAGAFVMVLLITLTGAAVTVCITLPFGLGELAALYFSWSGLALGGLVKEGADALRRVEQAHNDAATLPQARKAVQMLVSRDTGAMDADELCRALAESVSENINDAFVAPFFWLLLTGPVGLWVYKCASTMDSMWGYTNERWLLLGRAAARLDDALAWIPARLAALLMVAAFPPTRALPSTWPGWSRVIGQARLSASPNAGWPMAVAAWLFNGRNGGETPYHGRVTRKPFMGPEDGRWTIERTSALIRHAVHTGMLAGILGTLIFWMALAVLKNAN